MQGLYIATLYLLAFSGACAQLLKSPGDRTVISGWNLQSTSQLSDSLDDFSLPYANTSSWYRVSARGSVFAGLLENGVYNDTALFYSDNLESMVDYSDFQVSWVYQESFDLTPANDQHYFLVTNGITPKADIYLNGQVVATNSTQGGSYGGQTYDITAAVGNGQNSLALQVYPTNYLRDFAMGFVDWNPYPPDNGTGVWRWIELRQTGPVSLSSPRVTTDFQYSWQKNVLTVVTIDATNHANQSVNAEVNAVVSGPDGSLHNICTNVALEAGETKTVTMSTLLEDAQIWWPAQWGSQPLYSIGTFVTVNGDVSDINENRSFGIRHVSSYVNGYNDTAFLVNGHPFLVQGAGYSTDIFYRFDFDRARKQLQLVLDMGLNTIRLEGKQEHPELYELADKMGVMIMAGWECCDHWEMWSYNEDLEDVVEWTDQDYKIANASMLHEAAWMQTHPSMLAFLVGSDYWPNDRATDIYVSALQQYQWPNPIIASAAKRGYPELLGPSGMKMDGPYDCK
jgi:exo-1,4-beta-D-glucosaminidase